MSTDLRDSITAGVGHTDMGDAFRAWSITKREKRASNRKMSHDMLVVAGVKFEVRNLGAHLVVTGKSCIIDFWPGTGLWIVRQQTPRRRGVRGLLDFLAKEK